MQTFSYSNHKKRGGGIEQITATVNMKMPSAVASSFFYNTLNWLQFWPRSRDDCKPSFCTSYFAFWLWSFWRDSRHCRWQDRRFTNRRWIKKLVNAQVFLLLDVLSVSMRVLMGLFYILSQGKFVHIKVDFFFSIGIFHLAILFFISPVIIPPDWLVPDSSLWFTASSPSNGVQRWQFSKYSISRQDGKYITTTIQIKE